MEIRRTIPSLLVFCSECQAMIYEDYTDVPGGYKAARDHVKNTGHFVTVEEHRATEIRPTPLAARQKRAG